MNGTNKNKSGKMKDVEQWTSVNEPPTIEAYLVKIQKTRESKRAPTKEPIKLE